MKKIIFALTFCFVALLSGNVSAQGLVICQLVASGQTVLANQETPAPRGKVIAQINKARLPAGETCDTWRAKKEKEVTAGGCILLADGKQLFEGFGNEPPKRGTEVARGTPNAGETCDQWRDRKASTILNGIVE